MKKLLFVVSALAAFSLLAPSSGFAQWSNRIGVYTNPDALGTPNAAAIESQAAYTPATAYIVLTNPENGGAPVTQIAGFECKVVVNPLTAFAVSGWTVNNPGAVNVSQAPEFIVGYATPTPVAGNQVLLVTMNGFITATDPVGVFLQPTAAPSIPNSLVYVDATSPPNKKVAALQSSGSADLAVFTINNGPNPVSEEAASFGTVKSLFR